LVQPFFIPEFYSNKKNEISLEKLSSYCICDAFRHVSCAANARHCKDMRNIHSSQPPLLFCTGVLIEK
jgi:hypothetical protein